MAVCEKGGRNGRFRPWSMCVQWVVILGLLGVTGWMAASGRGRDSPTLAAPVAKPVVPSATLAEIMCEGPQELARRRIAELNLLAGTGLAGVEAPDVSACLATLDDWARVAGQERRRRSSEFSAEARKYEGSRARFLATLLAEALRDRVGVNLLGLGDLQATYLSPKDVFIHGCLERKTATSLSAPIIYVAVGRRLGYSLHLAMAGRTVIVRWDDVMSRQALNIHLGGSRITFPPDSFHAGPATRTRGVPTLRGRKILTLDRKGELAYFLSLRGRCLVKAGRLHDAQVAFAQAHRLAPQNPLHFIELSKALEAELGGHALAAGRVGRGLPGVPDMGPIDPMAELRGMLQINAKHGRAPGMPVGPPELPGALGLPRSTDPFEPVP